MVISFLKLIRYKNLILLAFLLIVIRYGFLKLQNIPLALSDFNYMLLIFSMVLIAAAGYVINDIFDQDTDAINKPKLAIVGNSITESQAYNSYAFLNISGVLIGFYLANVIGKPGFASIFIVIAASLYVYASGLKRTVLFGNILVAFLTSFTIIIVGIFDLYPILSAENQATQAVYFRLLIDYAIFAFIINMMREIVKDLQDIHGDNEVGMRTLPIAIGITKTKIGVGILAIVAVMVILNYCHTYYFLNALYFATAYILLTVLSPLILFAIKIFSAQTTKDFAFLSRLLKVIIFFGILSAYIVTLNILHNAKG